MYYIPSEDSEVEYFLVDLLMGNGVVEVEKYNEIENRFPKYFDYNGFIPYNDYLDSILWMPDVKGFCAYTVS